MAPDFCFAIRRADLPAVDRLRLAMGSDFYPAAAFAIFEAARSIHRGEVEFLPATARSLATVDAKARGYGFVISRVVRVRQEAADPAVVAWLERVAVTHRLASAKVAALAILADFAADPAAYPIADDLRAVA